MSSVGVLDLGRGMAQLQHAEAHRVVRRRHFQRDAAIEARAHARLERFQFGRRPVGRDHHLLGAVEQHVDQVAELVLDRLALQELHVVDDQQVDVAQLLLQRQRIVVADRGGEAPHEIFGRQIDDARLRVLLQRFRRDRLQQVRLAEPDRGMQEERVEARHRDCSATARAAASATRFDGPSMKELESVALVERRAEHALAELGRGEPRPSAAPAARSAALPPAIVPEPSAVCAGRAVLRAGSGSRLDRGARLPRGAAHDDLDA